MPTETPTSLETATAESADALATMESEAAEFFANRDTTRTAEALNPVAPALEKAVAAPAKPAAKAAAPVAKAAPVTGKVAGPPTLKAPVAAAETPKADSDPAKTTAPDISDLPTEYTPGKIRAPHWEKLRANRDHFEAVAIQRNQEIENLRAELAAKSTAQPAADVTERLAALQKERDDLVARLEVGFVEKSPIFEQQFKPRLEAALAAAKVAAGPADAERVATLLQQPESAWRDQQIEEVLVGMTSPLRASKLAGALAELDRIQAEKSAVIANSSQNFKLLQTRAQEAEARAQQERSHRLNSTFESELKEWEAAGVTPDEVAAARSVYSGNGASLQDASRAALWGAVGPRVVQQLQTVQAEKAELEAELKRLRGAQPGVGAGGSGALPSTPDDDDDPNVTSMADRIAKQAMRAGIRFGG
jgi:hypothetical protein